MRAEIWRLYCVLLAGLTAWGSPAVRQTEAGQGGSEDPCSAQQNASGDGAQRWPGGIIPYVLSESLSSDVKVLIMASMHLWENCSCTVFLPRTNQPNYAVFEPGENCCSGSGRAANGFQRVSIGNGCNGDHSIDDTLQKLLGIPNGHENTAVVELGSEIVAGTPQQGTNTPTGTDVGMHQPTMTSCKGMCGFCMELDAHNERFGFIKSPNYPNYYPTNTECVWKLTAPPGYTIRTTFHDFDVELGPSCNYDSVDVFQLDANGRTLQHRQLCGSGVPEVITTAGTDSDTTIIRLHSDESYEGRGFLVRYELAENSAESCDSDDGGCDQICVADAQGLKKRCACREGYTLAEDERTCRDINECAHRRGGCDQRCTNTEGSFQCHCRYGFSLRSDGKTCRECGGVHNATSGTILSPGHPSPYPPYQNCLWTIAVHPNHRLRITIQSLDIAPSVKCSREFLKLKHGHFAHKRKLCGYYPEVTYLVQEEDSMYVRFHTEDINSYHSSGFRLEYSQVPIEDVTELDRQYVLVDGVLVLYKQRLWVTV